MTSHWLSCEGRERGAQEAELSRWTRGEQNKGRAARRQQQGADKRVCGVRASTVAAGGTGGGDHARVCVCVRARVCVPGAHQREQDVEPSPEHILVLQAPLRGEADDAEGESVREADAREQELVLGDKGRAAADAVEGEADAVGEIEEGHLALRAEPPHELEARILIPRGLKPIARAEDRPPAIGEDLADCDGRKRPGSALRARLAQRTARGALLLHVTSYAQCSVHGMHRERRISDSCSYAIAVARLKSKSDELDAEGMDDAAYGAARSRRHWWE